MLFKGLLRFSEPSVVGFGACNSPGVNKKKVFGFMVFGRRFGVYRVYSCFCTRGVQFLVGGCGAVVSGFGCASGVKSQLPIL